MRTLVLKKNQHSRGYFSLIIAALMTILILAASNDILAADATPTTITVYWTSPGDDGSSGTASEYDIRYSTSMINAGNWDYATQVTSESSPQIAGSQESFTITGLTPSTTYYIAITTADEVPNWSGLSNVISVTTLAEDTPPARIAGLSIDTKTSTSVTLNWTAPGADDDVGTASVYDIRFSTSFITAANWDAATQVTGEPSPQAAGSNELFTVTGLFPNTQYYFAIKAADDTPNWSELSNIVSTTTDQESTAPASVANLDVQSVTGSSVVLTWTAPGDDGNSGTASQYDIRYSLSPITDANWDAATQVAGEPSPQAAGTGESSTVTGLNSDTQYYFAIKTADEVPNWSGLSNVATATTPDITPPASIMDLSRLFEKNNNYQASNTLPLHQGNVYTVYLRPETGIRVSLSGQTV
ncbi:MAG: fibronectin type III domain-containing protein [candidate division Zixibacteria bacterium]